SLVGGVGRDVVVRRGQAVAVEDGADIGRIAAEAAGGADFLVAHGRDFAQRAFEIRFQRLDDRTALETPAAGLLVGGEQRAEAGGGEGGEGGIFEQVAAV